MRKIHFFEWFAAANLVVIALLDRAAPRIVSPLAQGLSLLFALALQAAAGIAIRLVIARVRGDRSYWRHIRRRSWLIETIRIVVAGAVMVTTYLWIKLVVPIQHPRLFDQLLWDLDQALLFGIAPALFLLELFDGAPLRAFDFSYAWVFYVSSMMATAYFVSDPNRRLRIAFANGNTALWIIGAWLYMLVPSVGPAYRFPEIWLERSQYLPVTQNLQALLMRNYQNVLRAVGGGEPTVPVRMVFGIGAFPSLHVGFQLYVFLWMRKVWTSGEIIFGIFVVTMFLGSMITGWHYMVDGLAGAVLALAVFASAWRAARLGRCFRATAHARRDA